MDTPRLVRWTRNLEDTAALDGAVRALEPLVDAAFATGRRGEVLRGDWLGHAVHPVLTDVVLGTWTSATILDLVGGRGVADRRAATARRQPAGRRPHGLDRLGRVGERGRS